LASSAHAATGPSMGPSTSTVTSCCNTRPGVVRRREHLRLRAHPTDAPVVDRSPQHTHTVHAPQPTTLSPNRPTATITLLPRGCVRSSPIRAGYQLGGAHAHTLSRNNYPLIHCVTLWITPLRPTLSSFDVAREGQGKGDAGSVGVEYTITHRRKRIRGWIARERTAR
jgi:hypothetical protein